MKKPLAILLAISMSLGVAAQRVPATDSPTTMEAGQTFLVGSYDGDLVEATGLNSVQMAGCLNMLEVT